LAKAAAAASHVAARAARAGRAAGAEAEVGALQDQEALAVLELVMLIPIPAEVEVEALLVPDLDLMDLEPLEVMVEMALVEALSRLMERQALAVVEAVANVMTLVMALLEVIGCKLLTL
jgi:hypothetical protein